MRGCLHPAQTLASPTQKRRSVCVAAAGSPPNTKKAAEPLSATVSAKLIFQSAMRLSMISIAATAQSEAAATSSGVAFGFDRSRASTSATSASAFGCRTFAPGSGPRSTIAISSNSTP